MLISLTSNESDYMWWDLKYKELQEANLVVQAAKNLKKLVEHNRTNLVNQIHAKIKDVLLCTIHLKRRWLSHLKLEPAKEINRHQRSLIIRGPLGQGGCKRISRKRWPSSASAHTTLPTLRLSTTASLTRLMSFTVWKQAVGKQHKPATYQVGRLDETQRKAANIFGQP